MSGRGRRYYPPAEEQSQFPGYAPGQPNPAQQPTSPTTQPFVPTMTPLQPQPSLQPQPATTPFYQTQTPLQAPVPTNMVQSPIHTSPVVAPASFDQGYQQPQMQQQFVQPQQSYDPTFGQNSAPPVAHSQMETSYAQQTAQQQQPQLVTKSKHVFALDPESTYPTDQLTSSMSQMGLNQQQQQPLQQQQQQQPQPQYGSQGATIAPSNQYVEEVTFNQTAQCPPIYMRMTMNAVPDSTSLLNKCNIPYGAMVHPMAESDNPQDKIPTVNFGVTGIIRCRKCRAYINPFVAFTDGGRRWRCNLCGLSNDVPGEYFSPLDRNGRRLDVEQRLELSKGCVEFIAPSEYMVRPPMPPTYFFVIDVGYYSIVSGMLHTAVQAIKSVLNEFPGDTRTRIGFITFDSTVHFYNLKSSLSNPQMLVVSDIEDVFIPLPDDLLVNLSESKAIVETLLNKLPNIHQSTQIVESALGVALKAAYQIIKNIGGKIFECGGIN